MNKRLDELVEIYGNSRAVENDWSPRCHSTDEVRKHYRAGANALLAELIPRVERLFNAAKAATYVGEIKFKSNVLAGQVGEQLDAALTEWREFMGEG